MLAAGGWLYYSKNAWRFHFEAAGPVNNATQVNGFEIAVTVGSIAKKVEVRRMTADRYAEIDENGNQVDLHLLGRIIHRGCAGSLLNDGSKYIYFPDKLCSGMLFYISENGRDFGAASHMINVR